MVSGYRPGMASSMFDKAARWARSPQGQRAIAKAQQVAKDPATRAKVQQLRGRAEAVAKDPATREKIDKVRERLNRKPGDGPPAAPRS
jgi:hypothetical protein